MATAMSTRRSSPGCTRPAPWDYTCSATMLLRARLQPNSRSIRQTRARSAGSGHRAYRSAPMAKHWMAEAFANAHGQLHKQLGVPKGQKIPPEKLEAAAKKGGKEGM